MSKLVVFTISTIWLCPALAGPVINTDTKHYEFDATSRKEIWQKISKAENGGTTSHGASHGVRVAWTSFSLELKYQIQAGLYKCELVNHIPILNVTIHLPYWKNKWQADEILANNWDNYVRMVSRHEQIHQSYAIKAAQDLDKRLSKIGVLGSCDEIQEKVEEIRNQVIAENKASNKIFDAKERVYREKLRWF